MHVYTVGMYMCIVYVLYVLCMYYMYIHMLCMCAYACIYMVSLRCLLVMQVCKQFTGYLRMALDGPDFEKK